MLSSFLSQREQQGAQQAQDMEIQNIECDDPHEKVRAPMVEVESYPRLIEAIPSLETDFFRSPIPEEERKEIIYECPKFLGMKYTPPPLNEAATSAVRKNDATFYGIQMALANLTRPIDDYVHRKLKNPSTMIQGNEDLEIIKSITIIALKDKKEITSKARAIGATIAAKTGISTDAILTQANWSSYYMFSSYYKLSNDSYSNITESVLSELT
ncbi:hypothetical protein BB561_003543 [Smittium simulii]|uniref:Uncharacterized protein n=1 Tax=Smittium simulii TaxID=133385 RepID=A0A2T9YKT1_9FUNG|nr:hypothetical protein BB561_003543 [Smittium simulii]